jgi:hypothetical protein
LVSVYSDFLKILRKNIYYDEMIGMVVFLIVVGIPVVVVGTKGQSF